MGGVQGSFAGNLGIGGRGEPGLGELKCRLYHILVSGNQASDSSAAHAVPFGNGVHDNSLLADFGIVQYRMMGAAVIGEFPVHLICYQEDIVFFY